MGMPTMRDIQEATAKAVTGARTSLEARITTLTCEIASAINGDTGTQVAAVQIAGTANALANMCKTLNEVRDSVKWSGVADTWRRTAELRGSARP